MNCLLTSYEYYENPLRAGGSANRASRSKTDSRYIMTGDRLIQLLIKHGLVDPCAYEDPEGYDNWRTMGQCNEAAIELSKLIQEEKENRAASSQTKMKHE